MTAGILLAGSTLRSRSGEVTVQESDRSYTLANGIITAVVSKRSGDLLSLKYKGLEMLDTVDQPQSGYWSHNTARGNPILPRVTIDPRANGGARGEVSVKGISGGRPMGSGPGGSVVADIEIRYALGRDDSALYTYSIFTHPTNYPATSVGEARFCIKLNDDVFDWMTVDSRRNMKMITAYDWNHGTVMNFKETRRMNTGPYKGMVEHKYDYAANQFDVRTWGWSSTAKHVGIWFINPSVEYLSGGPTKVELSAHRDATFNPNALHAPAPPCLLNYWRSSHYGGSVCSIAATDAWTKVIGPFLIYCNSGRNHDGLWKDALARQSREERAWPYGWVEGVDYPHRDQRGSVSGRIVIRDPQAPHLKIKNLLVGLSAPEYTPPPMDFRRRFRFRRGAGPGRPRQNQSRATNEALATGPMERPGLGANTNRFGRRGGFGGFGFGWFFGPRTVDWQNDARHYEFWVRADARGHFSIPNVRPGSYTLHAIADGVLGEFARTNIQVEPGGHLALGTLAWQPVRYGKQLWDIGIPNRTASEFFGGDDYYHWGWYLKYPKLFPDDVNFVVGRSDFRKDWFFEQVPHDTNPNDTTGTGFGRSTTWSVTFKLSQAPRGRATLRLAICGVGTRELSATINGKSIGSVTNLFYNAVINRDGITGSWAEHDLSFDASLMNAGQNVLKLTIPAGPLTSGIMYDYLRLELAEGTNSAAREAVASGRR